MKAMHTLRFSGKIVLLVGLLAFGAFALARESRPARASTTQLYLVAKADGTAGSCADPAVTSLVLSVGGPAQDMYLCAKSIDDPYGAAAFTLDFSYVSWLVAVQSVSIDNPAFLPATTGLASQWLGSTGRAVACGGVNNTPNPDTGQGRVDGGCSTFSPPPPLGPTSNVTLAKITISPGITKAVTSLNFRGNTGTNTQLVSAYFPGGSTGAVIIPATPPLLAVDIAPCSDLNGDHYVAIIDILNEARAFGKNSSQPGWNPNWDMDGNNMVSILDVLIAARQFGRQCP